MRTSRRTFLKLNGASLGIALFNIVPAHVLGRSAPSHTINMGMIGLGARGWFNMEAFLGIENVKIRAVCDVDRAKMAAAQTRVNRLDNATSCQSVGDFRELCADPDIDAVMIATPNHAHAVIAIEAACHGKAIYGETPFTLTQADGERLLKVLKRHRCVWQTGAWQRGHPIFRQAVAAVRQGALGPLKRVEIGIPGGGWAPDCPPSPVPADYHWRWIRKWGGGILYDWIGHYGDLAIWGAGRQDNPVAVEGRGDYGANNTATSFHYHCLYADGLEMEIASGGRLEKGVGVRWLGHNGEWLWVTRGALQSSVPARIPLPVDPIDLYQDFIACVRTRAEPIAPAADAHRAATLAHLGDAAMLKNEWRVAPEISA